MLLNSCRAVFKGQVFFFIVVVVDVVGLGYLRCSSFSCFFVAFFLSCVCGFF